MTGELTSNELLEKNSGEKETTNCDVPKRKCQFACSFGKHWDNFCLCLILEALETILLGKRSYFSAHFHSLYKVGRNGSIGIKGTTAKKSTSSGARPDYCWLGVHCITN